MQTTTTTTIAEAEAEVAVTTSATHNKIEKQQSNTTFGGKLIDFGAIQWLWKVLQRIINYLELNSTHTHTFEMIRNIFVREQKNEKNYKLIL